MPNLGKLAKRLTAAAVSLIPAGNAGVAVKAALGLVMIIWWTSGPGKEEEMDFKAQQEPDRRSAYNRHYAFKGRGRKEFLRQDQKDNVDELVFTRQGAGL